MDFGKEKKKKEEMIGRVRQEAKEEHWKKREKRFRTKGAIKSFQLDYLLHKGT